MNSPIAKLDKSKTPLSNLVIPTIIVLLALMLSMSRAFNTGDMAPIYRLTMWLIVCGLVAVQVLGFLYLLHRYISPSFVRKVLLLRILAITLTIPLVAIQLHLLKYTPVLPKEVDPPLEFLVFVAPPVAVIGAIFLLAQYLLQQPSHKTDESLGASAMKGHGNEENSKIEDTSSPEWRRSNILRIQVDDHYLRIFSETGDFYIRSKMSDAVSLLKPDEGIQAHRSHWVSFRYVRALVKDGRDYRLLLNNGGSVPVSRGRLNTVRESLNEYKE